MPSILADYRTHVLNTLGDPTGNRYTTTQLDEAIRAALMEYSAAAPTLQNLAFLVVTTGRDHALTGTTNLNQIVAVQYPVDAADSNNNRVQVYYLSYYAGAPVLHLQFNMPQAGETINITYTASHTITNLDSALSTTIPTVDDALLTLGASAHAAIARSTQITEQMTQRASNSPQLAAWGQARLAEFRSALDSLAKTRSDIFVPQRAWQLDHWDRQPNYKDLPFI